SRAKGGDWHTGVAKHASLYCFNKLLTGDVSQHDKCNPLGLVGSDRGSSICRFPFEIKPYSVDVDKNLRAYTRPIKGEHLAVILDDFRHCPANWITRINGRYAVYQRA